MTRRAVEELDVVVVGSGAGALVGALSAARRGLRTLVIEKTDRFGGTTAYSGGGIWLPGNEVIRRGGVVDDSVELGRRYLRTTVGERTPAALQDAFLETGPRLVAELEEDPALEFEWRPFPDYFESAPGGFEAGRSIYALALPIAEVGSRAAELRSPLPADRGGSPQPEGMLIGGRALLGRLLMALDRRGVECRRNTALTALVVDDGRVVGLEVADPSGRTAHLGVTRGVLLAAGGFEHNEEMRRAHQPVGARFTMGSPGGTGDAIRCGVAIGAATDLLDDAWWSPGFLLPDGTAAFRLYERGRPGTLVVNGAGVRYANETLPYDQFGHAMIEGERSGIAHLVSYLVFDQRFLDTYAFCGVEPGTGLGTEWYDSGAVVAAATVAALGRALQLPAGALERTVEQFNGFVRRGVDEQFHRGERAFDRFFGDPAHGPNRCLGELSEPPFYAATIVLSDLGTKGGLVCDEHARVLDRSHAPIAGLYAAGNTMASVMGNAYPGPGCPIGSSMVFAHLAAVDMGAMGPVG